MKVALHTEISIDHPTLEDVAKITRTVIGFLRDHGMTDNKFLSELDLALTEAINNAIEHGCLADPNHPTISVRAVLTPESLTTSISDPSDFPGWEGKVALPDDPFSEGGRGRFLIESLTDEARHDVVDGRHVLTLVRNLHGLHWEYEPGSGERILSSMMEEVAASYEMINALIGLGELLATAEDIDLFLKLALMRVCELTRAEGAYVRMSHGETLDVQRQTGDLPVPESIHQNTPCVEAEVFRTGEEVTLTGKPDESDPLARVCSSAFVAPIFYKSDRKGVLVLLNAGKKQYFDAAQLKVARVVGEYLGIVSAISELQMRRQSEQRALRELEIAEEIQLSLMPTVFEFGKELDIYGVCQPALRAGGDYFDVIRDPSGGALLVCADVMGKGVSAALFSSMLRTNIRALIAMSSQPGKLLTEVNRNLAHDLGQLDMFITVACIWIAPDLTELHEANAGHNPGLLIKNDNTRQSLKSQGLPVGILPDTAYETHVIPFDPGDLLLLLTDGIPEACNRTGTYYGDHRLRQQIEKLRLATAEDLVRGILADVDLFAHHTTPSDDRTLMAVRRKTPTPV